MAFLATLALPVTIDPATMSPEFKSALAASGANGNGNGNGDGQGKGKGNGKGQGDENGGRKPPKGGGADDDDDDDDADDDDGGFGGGDSNGQAARTAHSPDNGGADDGGELDEAAYTDALSAVAGVSGDDPAALSAPALPTIQQIFALGEGSVLDDEQESLAIQNGWNAQN